MAKHTCEPALDSCSVTVRFPLSVKYKLLRRYGKKRTLADIVKGICEHMVEDVALTRAELGAIGKDMEAALEKRMKNRERISAINRRNADAK